MGDSRLERPRQRSGDRRAASGSRGVDLFGDPSFDVSPAEFTLFELPIVLIELQEFHIVLMSEVVRKRLGGSAESIIGRPIIDFVEPEWRAAATEALSALRDGAIDFYRTQRTFVSNSSSELPYTGWARAVEFGGRRHAFVQFAFDAAPGESPLAELLGLEPVVMAVGTVDSNWVITSISRDVTQLLGVTPELMIGRVLLGGSRGTRRARRSRKRPHGVRGVLRCEARAT